MIGRLTMAVIVAALLLLPMAACADWTEQLLPDAAALGISINRGDSLEALCWDLGPLRPLGERRVWVDIYRPLNTPGLGGSIDLTGGEPAFLGGAYVRGSWHALVGAHLQL